MKKLLAQLLFSAIFLCIAVFSTDAQTREVSYFDGVSTGGSVSVKLEKADQQGVKIKMLSGDIDDIITEVKDKTLKIKTKNKWTSGWTGKKAKAKVIVYYTELDDISASAGSSIISSDIIKADDLDIDASSGASIKLQIEARQLDSDVSSGASIKLTGECKDADFGASSGASLKAGDLEADNVEADVSSGASIYCHANKSIEAEASSGGSVTYGGDPEKVDVDGGRSGSIRRN